MNGDLSGDDRSISSDHPLDNNDENSMDSDRGGALNLVRLISLLFAVPNIKFIEIILDLQILIYRPPSGVV